MKYLLVFILLSACAEKEFSKTNETINIQGSNFKVTAAPLITNAVESSLINYNNKINVLSDIGMNGNLSLNNKTIANGYRFSYIMKNKNIFYNFFQQNGNIAMESSLDLINWSISQIVLTASNDNFLGMWNPSVTVDDNNVWHILVECEKSSDNSKAGLCYSHSTMQNDTLNFDSNKQQQLAIDYAGNAWMQYIPEKGIVVIYGKQINDVWQVRAGILNNGIIKENKNFRISENNIHICDPHAIETESGIILTISYDQNSVYELRSSETMIEFFDKINHE